MPSFSWRVCSGMRMPKGRNAVPTARSFQAEDAEVTRLPTLLRWPVAAPEDKESQGQAPLVLPGVVCAGAHSSKRRRSCALALAAIEGCLAWNPLLLQPLELARMAAVAQPLCTAVAEACAQQLRAVHFFPLAPGGTASLANSERQLHRAQRHSVALRPTCVAAENYSTGIDAQGRLLIWGRPGWLELRTDGFPDYDPRAGWPALRPHVALPVSSSDFCSFGDEMGASPTRSSSNRVVSLAASRHAVFALTAEGCLMYAQVRRNTNMVIQNVELHPLKELLGVRVAQISTRFGQAFAVTADGSVYAWGMKSGDPQRPEHNCSMGFGEITTLLHPTLIPSFGPSVGSTPIRFVATGISHTVFVSIFGEAYTVGRTENGKLGLGSGVMFSDHVTSPTKVHFDERPVPLIISAAAGARHSLLLSNLGEVWGCGLAKSGALPLSRRGCCSRPSVLLTPKHLDAVECFCTAVAAGISISFFVGEGGEVHFSGLARQTQKPFGRPLTADPWEPRRIPGLKQVEQVSVSMELSFYQWEHAIFARQDGTLWAWGHLGHGEFQSRGETACITSSAGSSTPRSPGARLACRVSPVLRRGCEPTGFCNAAVPIEPWRSPPA